MKRSFEEFSDGLIEGQKAKLIKPSPSSLIYINDENVVIVLDQTLKSHHLYAKFNYLTTDLQLLLQTVSLFTRSPWDIIGTDREPGLDLCIFKVAMRNSLSIIEEPPCDVSIKTLNPHEILRKYLEVFDQELEELGENIVNPYACLLFLKNCTLFHLEGRNQRKQDLRNNLIELLDDKMYMMDAVKYVGAIRYASDRLKDDLDVILQAVKKNGNAISHASQRLKENEQVILEAIKNDQSVLDILPTEIRDNKRIMLEAVKRYGFAYTYASERLKKDQEFAKQAIEESSDCVFKFFSETFKDDEQLVMKAVQKNSFSFKYASDRLRDDNEIFTEAARKSGTDTNEKKPWFPLNSASQRLRFEEPFELLALTTNVKYYFPKLPKIGSLESTRTYSVTTIRNQLRKDKTFMLLKIGEKGSNFTEASECLQKDEQFVVEAIKIVNRLSDSFWNDIPQNLRGKKEIIVEALKNNWFRSTILEILQKSYETESQRLLKHSTSLAIQAAENNEDWIKTLTDQVRDKQFALKYFEIEEVKKKKINARFLEDEQIILTAIYNPFAIQCVSNREEGENVRLSETLSSITEDEQS